MKLSDMRQLLAAGQVQLSRALGQNFLHDAHQLRCIVALARLQPGARVLEIGPGLGPLTEGLLAAGADVLAVEKDARLVALLAGRLGVTPATTRPDDPELQAPAVPGRLRLVHADALRWLQRTPGDWSGWQLVANLPYSVASPLLVELATAPRPPDRLVVTLQREVVRRLTAGAGEPDYGLLTLLVRQRFVPETSFRIPADCFFPVPEVESGCVALDRRIPEPLTAAERRVFGRVVKRAFSERRKKALKLLKFDWPAAPLEAAWQDLALDPNARAETLSDETFFTLTRRLAPLSPP